MATESPNRVVKVVFQSLLWALSGLGFLAGLLMLLCPRFNSRMDEWTTSVKTVPVQVQQCTLRRNGNVRENEVLCTYAYTFEGQPYTATSAAWSSDSPFTTSADLARALNAENGIRERFAHVYRYAPSHAELIDERWIVAPPLWFLLALLFVGFMAVSITLIPSMHHREDLVYRRGSEPGSRDELVEAPGRWTRNRTNRMVRTLALGCIALICLYSLSNRPDEIVHRAAITGLQLVPARLAECAHEWHGTTKGVDEIRCSFKYAIGSKAYSGRAESMEYRLFPTNARMDAQVAKVMQSPSRVAYVDPQHPTYAWAYIDEGWIALYSWGIFEGIVVVFLFVVLPVLLKETIFPKS